MVGFQLFCFEGEKLLLKLFAAGDGFADFGFEVVVEMVESVAKRLVAFFNAADEHSAFECADDE